MVKDIIKAQFLAIGFSMLIVLFFVQFINGGTVQARSILSILILLKSVIILALNVSFYLVLINPKSKLLGVLSFSTFSILDVISMILKDESNGIKFTNNGIKTAFILLTIFNLVFALTYYRIYSKKKWGVNAY